MSTCSGLREERGSSGGESKVRVIRWEAVYTWIYVRENKIPADTRRLIFKLRFESMSNKQR